MLQDVLRRERSDLGPWSSAVWSGEGGVPVTHVISITFEDLPKYVDELVVPRETATFLYLERLVGFSYENGVQNSGEWVD